ncbi:hypothetical protein V1477_016822 [Vespula maculifrons]|uniref:Uncharacterized protein n=1 Tax=Vespula maculifrons TaxID=7453 RepID=A0ABD2B4B0_VESMC
MENDSKTLKAEDKCDEGRKDNVSYWKRMMRGYEKRNASLERRRAALIERVHFMECALPSLLMSAAVVSTNRSEQSPKVSCHDGTSGRLNSFGIKTHEEKYTRYLIITDPHVNRKSKGAPRYE